MNLVDIFKLPQTNKKELTLKKVKYLELIGKAIDEEDYNLAAICRDNIQELKIKEK